MNILLVDDHALVRAGLGSLLKGMPGVRSVAEAADGVEALERIAADPPDVVLADLSMPGMGGIELTSRIADRFPAVKVLIVTMHREEEYVSLALGAGASGFLLKDSRGEELGLALRAMERGEGYLSPAASARVFDGLRRKAGNGGDRRGGAGADDPGGPPPLTPRQLEVLRLVAEGHTTKSIARELGVAVKTVEAHRSQVMARLGLRDVAGLVRYAIDIGLVRAGR